MSSEKLPFAPLFATICTLILVNWPYFRIALSMKKKRSDSATGSFSTTYLRGLYHKMCDCQHYMHGGKKKLEGKRFWNHVAVHFVLTLNFGQGAKSCQKWKLIISSLLLNYFIMGFVFFFLRRVRVDLELVERKGKWLRRKVWAKYRGKCIVLKTWFFLFSYHFISLPNKRGGKFFSFPSFPFFSIGFK